MRRQKGQAIVEFALVLPLFFLFFWGMVYTGLLYKDYLTLSNIARESARAVSIQGMENSEAIRYEYAQRGTLSTNLYTWKGDEKSFKIESGTLPSSVKVTLTAELNGEFPGVGVMDFLGIPLKDKYESIYSMYQEPSS